MTRLSNSWKLFKISWGVLRNDTSLAMFPVLGGIAVVAVAAAFGGLFVVTGVEETTSATGTTSTGLAPIGYVFIALAYVAIAFVTVYFQAGLTVAADRSLRGEDSTVGGGLREANARLPILFAWALVVATISLIIRAIEERFGFLGRIVAGLFGAAWNIVTFLAIPVVVIERVGPGRALKRSGSLLKQTWGENIVGQFGFGLFALVAMLPAFALFAGAAGLMSVVSIPLVAIGVVWVLGVVVVVSALTGIYRVALYRFAVDEVPPLAFAGADFDQAFRQRGGRAGF